MFKKEILLTLSVGAKRLQSNDSQLPSRSENYLFFLHLFVDWRSCKKSFEHFTGCRIYFFEFLTCVIKLVENHRCRVSFLYWINPAGRRNEFLLSFFFFFFYSTVFVRWESIVIQKNLSWTGNWRKDERVETRRDIWSIMVRVLCFDRGHLDLRFDRGIRRFRNIFLDSLLSVLERIYERIRRIFRIE